jgi:hypothetical protein
VFGGFVSAVCTPDFGAQPAENHKQTSLKQDPPKRTAEVLIEDGVNDGIEGRVHVTKPEGCGECSLWYLTPTAHWRQNI